MPLVRVEFTRNGRFRSLEIQDRGRNERDVDVVVSACPYDVQAGQNADKAPGIDDQNAMDVHVGHQGGHVME